jgi:hypothetical protein
MPKVAPVEPTIVPDELAISLSDIASVRTRTVYASRICIFLSYSCYFFEMGYVR